MCAAVVSLICGQLLVCLDVGTLVLFPAGVYISLLSALGVSSDWTHVSARSYLSPVDSAGRCETLSLGAFILRGRRMPVVD